MRRRTLDSRVWGRIISSSEQGILDETCAALGYARCVARTGGFDTDDERARVLHHYTVERELADRLRNAPREQRQALYAEVYDELFQRVPFHPQLQWKDEPAQSRERVERQLKLLGRVLRPGITFLELGAGDCSLSAAVAPAARKVYAVEVSEEITKGLDLPGNVEVVISDGTSIPVPAGTVDIAYSNSLMEHLHPDDAEEQLANVFAALAPGGAYLCVTQDGLSGPHDVSRHFDRVATGFHLHEYTVRELAGLFRAVGFSRLDIYLGGHGRFVRSPVSPISATERALEAMPYRLRKRAASLMPFRIIRLVGFKPG
jgi:SAM-dependent methyltransferase